MGTSFKKRSLVVLLTISVFLFVSAAAAFAGFEPPPPGSNVTITPGGENCNGIVPTPGSENTKKRLTGLTVDASGTHATYVISYPVDPTSVGDTWRIADCVLSGSGSDLSDYDVLDEATFSGVINSANFNLTFTYTIPANTPIGTRICNVAKTTQGPSDPQSSNRKAGPACFIVGGDARVEKHSTTDPNGAPIPGATFRVWNCNNTADDPGLQPIIVTPTPSSGDIYSNTVGGGGLISAATIGFSGASGSTCNVTETAPPPGYTLPPVADRTQTITIPVGSAGATVYKFLDPPAPGSVHIHKNAPASQQSTVFNFNITCTNPSATYPTSITGTGDSTVNDIPAGSVCQVTETNTPSIDNVSISPSGTFTVGSNQTVTVTVNNTLKPGSLTVTKVAPASGANTVYSFTVTCTNDPNSPYSFSITGSDSHTVSGIPAGSQCTVVETDPGSAYNPPGYSPSATVTIQPNATVTVTVTNTLKPGGLTVTKVAPAGSTESFSFTVTCTGDPNSPYPFSITGSNSHTINGIPAGSSCTVAEASPGSDFNAPQYSPNATVTVTANQTVTVTVTNVLKTGSLQVTKAAPANSTDTYHFTVTCTNPHTSPVGPYSFSITGSGSHTVNGVPAGSQCTVAEDDPGATYNPPGYSPSATVTVNGDATVTVTVTNTLRSGSVTITKVAPAEQQDQEFDFVLTCQDDPNSPYDLSVTGSDSVTQNGIPANSSCSVEEVNVPEVNATPVVDPAGAFNVGPTQTVTVTVTNTLKPLSILIVKDVTPTSGAPGDSVTYTYKVTNTGDVTLYDVTVTDDKLGDICTIAQLDPDESQTCTKKTTLPNAAGALTNVGTATGHDITGRTTSDDDDAVVTVVLAVPPLQRTGSTGLGTTAFIGVLLTLVGAVMATRKERGRVRPAFATSSAAGRAVMLAANRRSWRMRRRLAASTRARFRWHRKRAGPPRDGP